MDILVFEGKSDRQGGDIPEKENDFVIKDAIVFATGSFTPPTERQEDEDKKENDKLQSS